MENLKIYLFADPAWENGAGDMHLRDDVLKLLCAQAGFPVIEVSNTENFIACMESPDSRGIYLSRRDAPPPAVKEDRLFSVAIVNGVVAPDYPGFAMKFFSAAHSPRDWRDETAHYFDFLPSRVTPERLQPFKGLNPLALGAIIGNTDGLLPLFEEIETVGRADRGKLGWTTSSRTADWAETELLRRMAGAEIAFPFRSSREGYNPYMEILARAENLIVTSESLSMLSDCLHAGKKVWVWHLPLWEGRKDHKDQLGRYLELQEQAGYLKLYRGRETFNKPWTPIPIPLEWPGICEKIASTFAGKYNIARTSTRVFPTQSLSASL